MCRPWAVGDDPTETRQDCRRLIGPMMGEHVTAANQLASCCICCRIVLRDLGPHAEIEQDRAASARTARAGRAR